MKKLKILILLLYVCTTFWGQNKLVEYEYWFNNDYENKQIVEVTPSATLLMNRDFDISSFPDGVNIFNIRYKDENGKFSSTLSKVFVKFNSPVSIQNKLVEYEYWFDSDYANKQIISVTPTVSHQLSADLDVSALPIGEHVFNVRYSDENGKHSIILSKSFEKTENTVGITDNIFEKNIVVYPNPTNGFVTIQLGETLNVFSVRVTDISGKEISNSQYKNTDRVDMNLNVQPGIYLLTIKSDDKKATIRLIKH